MNKEFEDIKPVLVNVKKTGPIHIVGDFSFKNIDGEITGDNKELYICRCGGTKNPPYCDGTHKIRGLKS